LSTAPTDSSSTFIASPLAPLNYTLQGILG